jgi:hypothetical protein
MPYETESRRSGSTGRSKKSKPQGGLAASVMTEPAKLLLLASLLAQDRIISNNGKAFLKGEKATCCVEEGGLEAGLM